MEKTLVLGKIEGERRRWRQRMRWLDGITIINGHEFEQTPGDREFAQTGKPGVLQSMGLQRVRHDLATEQQHPDGQTGRNADAFQDWRELHKLRKFR